MPTYGLYLSTLVHEFIGIYVRKLSKVIKEALVYYFDMLKKESDEKSAYELGSEFFGKYSSGKDDLSTTYKQKLKDKINAKNNH